MEFDVQRDEDGIVTVSCPQPMEWRAREGLVDAFNQATGDAPCKGVIVDLKNVEYISSAGLGALFLLRKTAEGRQAATVLARPNPSVQRLLKTARIQEIIPVASDLTEARTKLLEPTA